jgi:hypothetical protein
MTDFSAAIRRGNARMAKAKWKPSVSEDLIDRLDVAIAHRRGGKPVHNDLAVADLLNDCRQRIMELKTTLGFFIEDDRFQVAVGGNPRAVEAMLEVARVVYVSGGKKDAPL